MRSVLPLLALSCTLVACAANSNSGGYYMPLGDGVSVGDDATVTDISQAADAKGGADTTTVDVPATPDVPQTPSLATCTLVSQCTHDDCDKNWSATCGAACAKAATSAATPTATALLACSTSKCLEGPCKTTGKPDEKCMDDCVGKQCTPQLAACWEQGATAGAAGCAAATTCFAGCDKLTTGKFTCQANCYTAMSAAGRSQFKGVASCLATAADSKACMVPTLECLGDGKQGSQSCYEAFPCVQGCGTDAACLGACYAKANAGGQQQLVALIDCVSGATPNDCLTQTVTCAGPSGSTGCMDLATCAQACPAGAGQAACVMTCLHGGTNGGATAFAKLASCIQQKCPNCAGSACQSCATSKCLSQAMACQGA